jgi:hypothetical protein
MSDVLSLRCSETGKQSAGQRGIMPVLVKVHDAGFLLSDVTLAGGNVPLGFSKVTQPHLVIHEPS